MDNQTYQCSAYFKLYGKDNLQVSFNICENDPDTHINLVDAYLNDLLSKGFSVEPKGLEPGEDIREADSWVLGETSKGDQCIHFYKSPLKWKVATMYQEDFDQLPFTIPSSLTPVLSAPEREAAEKRQLLRPLQPPIKLIMEPQKDNQGQPKLSESGNVIMRFSRVYGAEKRTNGNGFDREDDVAQEGPQELYPEVVQKIHKNAGIPLRLLQWARGEQHKLDKWGVDKVPATSEKLNLLTDVLDDLLQTPSSGVLVLSILTGKDGYDLDEVDGWVVDKLLETVPELIDVGGEIKDNPSYKEDTNKAIIGIWKEARTLVEE